jgi:hypothetical protein
MVQVSKFNHHISHKAFINVRKIIQEAHLKGNRHAITIVKGLESRFQVLPKISELLYGNTVTTQEKLYQNDQLQYLNNSKKDLDRCMYEIKTYIVVKDMIWNSVSEASMRERDSDKRIVNVERLASLL